MKIKKIEIENFRAIEKGAVDCIGYNVLVGPNGSGKSTVLDALNVFFGERNSFTEQDFFNKETDRTVKIKVTFDDLDAAATQTFDHYVRNGELVVHAQLTCDEEGQVTKVVRGERLVFPDFQALFEASNATAAKPIFEELRAQYPDISSASSHAARIEAVREFEETIDEDRKELVPSGEEFFGISKGANKIRRHVHWVYVPAVKDASGEVEEDKTSYLGKLIQHTVKSGMDYEESLEEIREQALTAYQTMLDGQQSHLESLQDRLSERLSASVTSNAGLDLSWKSDSKSVKVDHPVAKVLLQDRGFSGEIESFGHGLQRAFLIAILQELVAVDSDVSPTLILGCEEPELYQHPPQARHLASILMEMSQGDAQVLASSHSPYFIDVEHYDGIKMFRNPGTGVEITSSNFTEILEEYNSAFDRQLQNDDQIKTKLSIQTVPKFNEIFFSDKVVLLEGISDQACIEAYLRLSGRRGDFQKSGTALVVCEGKSSLVLMLIIAKKFGIPYHVIFDCDGNCADAHKALHLRDNSAILRLSGHPAMASFPTAHITHPNLTAWVNAIEGMLEEEFGAEKDAISEQGRLATGQLKNCIKYPLYVATVMSDAWDRGKTFPVLEGTIERILS
jgi:putative ATP-dependent endonuclease of the OLD family